MRVKMESEKAGLKFNIQKTKITASSPISSWQIDGGKVETVMDFIFLGSKITEDGDCHHEIKRSLPLGRKAMTNLDSVLKSRDITLMTKVQIVKAIVFPVVVYGSESWTINKAEHQRIYVFELEKTLESPWDSKEIKQSIIKEIDPEFSLEGLMLKLKLQYFGPPDMKRWPFRKDPDAGKTEGKRKWQHLIWLDSITYSMDMSLSKLGDSEGQGNLACCSP